MEVPVINVEQRFGDATMTFLECVFVDLSFPSVYRNSMHINLYSSMAVYIPFLWSNHRQQVGISALRMQWFPHDWMGFFETRNDEIPYLIICLPMCTPSHGEGKWPLISQFPLSHNNLENTVGLKAKYINCCRVIVRHTFKLKSSWQPNSWHFGHFGELQN